MSYLPKGKSVGLKLPVNFSIENSVSTIIQWGVGSTVWDNGNWHNEGVNNTRLTIPPSEIGKRIRASVVVSFDADADGIRTVALVRYNSSGVAQEQFAHGAIPATSAGETRLSVSGETIANSGDYIIATCFQNSGGAINVLSGECFIQVESKPI